MLTGGEDFFKDTNDDYSSGGKKSSFSDLPSDRVPMIESVYQEVLGRKPSTRELSYYKYGAMSEDDIRTKLLKSEEHTKLIANAKKISGIEDQLRNLQVTERRLLQRIEDLGNQIEQSGVLLNEKNSIIQELREELKNPYNLNDSLKRYEEGFDVYSVGRKEVHVVKERQSFLDFLKEILNMLIK